ncbi:MAG TPA: hypothetical protein PLF25_07080, partial [Accumulibacter sp.]|nr:hypothetical protein [Accumulibacter sp.]
MIVSSMRRFSTGRWVGKVAPEVAFRVCVLRMNKRGKRSTNYRKKTVRCGYYGTNFSMKINAKSNRFVGNP